MKLKIGIEKAIEVGWKYKHLTGNDAVNIGVIIHHKATILLDPTFWQALGACEWKSKPIVFMKYRIEGKTIEEAFDLATE